jgi:hypothetical protein
MMVVLTSGFSTLLLVIKCVPKKNPAMLQTSFSLLFFYDALTASAHFFTKKNLVETKL